MWIINSIQEITLHFDIISFNVVKNVYGEAIISLIQQSNSTSKTMSCMWLHIINTIRRLKIRNNRRIAEIAKTK